MRPWRLQAVLVQYIAQPVRLISIYGIHKSPKVRRIVKMLETYRIAAQWWLLARRFMEARLTRQTGSFWARCRTQLHWIPNVASTEMDIMNSTKEPYPLAANTGQTKAYLSSVNKLTFLIHATAYLRKSLWDMNDRFQTLWTTRCCSEQDKEVRHASSLSRCFVVLL